MQRVTTMPKPAGALQAMLLMFAAVLPVMGTLTMIPVMPILFKHFSSQPYAPLLVPMIITIPSVSMALIAPLAGIVGDRFSRRRLLIAATGAYALFGLLPVMLDSLVLILMARLVMGIADAFILTTANALIGDYFTGPSRSRWLAVQSGVGSVIATLIILASGFLGAFGWSGPVFMYALAIPVFLGLIFLTREPDARAQDTATDFTAGQPFPRGQMLVISVITLISAMIYFLEPLQISQVFSQLGMESSSQIGIATAIAGVGVPLGAWIYGRMARQRIDKQFLNFYAIFGAGLLFIALAGNQITVVMAAFIAQVGNGMLIPLMLGWVMKVLPAEHRAKGMGIWHTFFFLGMFISPVGVTAMNSVSGNLQDTLLVFAVISLLIALCLAFASIRTTMRNITAS
ncbi:MFS transporter [Leclercia sp. LTM14]|uniref:MFS transporter n=2 Tax=Enterobacteriaceae TaxID=543 RepID=A0ABS7S0G0_9ENTR|nr:MFS transporter [Leclercia sp. EMC7]MCM5702047.1 MFS transporter [Leclercia sp. LTM14]